MGKYSDVMGGLPKAGPTDPSFQEKVDAAKRGLPTDITGSASKLAEAYRSLRKAKDALDDKIKDLNVSVAAVEQLLWDSYEANGITSIKLDDGASVSVQPEPAASVKDHDALRAWAMANGFERSLTMPWQTVNAVAKERLLAGEPSPDGVELSVRSKTVLRKG